jgi:hypothetical protein
MVAFKAKFDGKVLIPNEPVNLPRNQELFVRIETAEGKPTGDQQSFLEWVEKNAVDDPSLPTDLSANLHHYLYGVPKRKP